MSFDICKKEFTCRHRLVAAEPYMKRRVQNTQVKLAMRRQQQRSFSCFAFRSWTKDERPEMRFYAMQPVNWSLKWNSSRETQRQISRKTKNEIKNNLFYWSWRCQKSFIRNFCDAQTNMFCIWCRIQLNFFLSPIKLKMVLKPPLEHKLSIGTLDGQIGPKL